jgi:hypothetical protein
MKKFESQLNDQKLTIELLYALFKALLVHLGLDYEIKENTGGYNIIIKKNGTRKH